MKRSFTIAACLLALVATTHTNALAQTTPRTVARLFWQDSDSRTVRWGDLKRGDAWSLQAQELAAFPKLDSERQSLVQMQHSDGLILAGIHDTEDGEFQSGWVAIESGVVKEEHGDHYHWHFDAQPKTSVKRLDEAQGNPAHVYLYSGNFYLANDKKNGLTMVTPAGVRSSGGKGADRFISAGGGHITLAAVDNTVAYSTWIDRDGENMGRVDVVGLTSQAAKSYSFKLPSGGIHGATENSGRVFFAPTDGVCWVDADRTLSRNAEAVTVNHLAIGEDAEGKPLRTGAFSNHRNYVLFNSGRGPAARLCMVDATSAKPSVLQLKMDLAAGTSLSTPVTVKTRAGEELALMFQESADGSQADKLIAVDLDPNRDGKFDDAKVARTLEVGKSKIEGHDGHHEVAACVGGRFVVLTNPGDGSIWVVSLTDFSVQAKLSVGGTPTRLISVGS